ncbi:ATP-binding protein [Fulvivirga sp.]|uniref:ATP-dependent nuclease n=1 Tax=Fulvivirga sp. TaxID=1931237 RepID=UPI0032EC58AE
MWIEKLHLKNIKSFQDETIEFGKGINILIGNNNSGKSTIIRTIDILQGQSHSSHGLIRISEPYGYAEIIFADVNDDFGLFEDPQKKKNGVEIRKKRRIIGNNAHVVLLADNQKHIICLKRNSLINRSHLDHLIGLPVDDKNNLTDNNLVKFNPFPDSEPDNVLYASYARRNFYESQINKDSTNRIKQDLGNLISRLQKLDNGNHYSHKDFKRACKSILGFEPGVIAQHENMGNNLTIGIYTDNINTIDINNMGQGVINVLGLLTILFTQEEKIILLEEIENDLHPEVLKKLLDLIIEKSNNNQFIISTHSNIVLRYLGASKSSRIFKTSWKMKKYDRQSIPHSKITHVPNNPENRLKVLSQMGYEIMDFELYHGYLIFEESTAELIVRDFLIPEFAPSLRDKLRTVSCNGVDDIVPKMKSFLAVFVFIHLSSIYNNKAWVIVDGDDAGLKVKNELRTTFSSWKPEHFVSLKENDFEHYYPKRFNKEVEAVLKMPRGKHKQRAKVELRAKVIEWTHEHRDLARSEFKTSAKEIISILKMIETSI